ncbi:MAG: phytanoyl-CoA dioxygenase family protein [Caldilineaceae bacterium]
MNDFQESPLFTAEQVAQYHRDGYVVARGLIDAETARRWKEVLQARLAQEGNLAIPSGVRVWMADDMDEFTGAQVCSERITAALQQLIGPSVEFLSVKAVFKNGQTNFASPWHHDWAYWKGSPKISIWIALDAADTDNGCLRMIPGSHTAVTEMGDVDDGKGFNARIGEKDVDAARVDTLPVERGDAVFFHDLTLHASCPNPSGRDRWTAIATYRNADQPDASTVWERSILLTKE